MTENALFFLQYLKYSESPRGTGRYGKAERSVHMHHRHFNRGVKLV